MKKQSQNKPNLPDAQMNVNKVLTKHYENVPLCRGGENKPKQSQFYNPTYPQKPAIITNHQSLITNTRPGQCYRPAGSNNNYQR